MDVSLKVTDQPQESAFYDMVSGDAVLSIPLFQRPYRWAQRNLEWLMDDIRDVRDDVNKSVFLGVVVCVSRGATPGRPIPWEIVDGQQRLSTLYLLILAAAEVAARNDAITWASGVIGTYLLVRPLSDNPVNTKLVPSYSDRRQFKSIWDGIMSIQGLADHPSIVANPPRPPAASGEERGALAKQFVRIRRMLGKVHEEEGQQALETIVHVAANKLSVVSISLRDPIVAPKIFERLNNRAELVTVADLVRNEVFARASEDATAAHYIFANHWEPFAARFSSIDRGLEKFLFPYGLIQRPTLTKADLFSQIRAHWSGMPTPQTVIADMEKYAGAFLSLEMGAPVPDIDPELNILLNRIFRMGRPSSTYAFLMRLTYAVQREEVDASVAASIVKCIEDFLFRRSICGIEPTGLHAVFKGMWGEIVAENGLQGVSAVAVRAAISRRTTVDWPTDAEFEAAIRTGNLFARNVCKYALQEFEAGRDGETPQDDFEKEHILPQTLSDEWSEVFGESYDSVVNTWANLIPLSTRMNPAVGNGPYAAKRAEYRDSIFASAREIARDCDTWGLAQVQARATQIVQWALSRWPTTRAS